MPNRRVLNLFGFLCCLGLLGFAWYSQVVLKLEPCPLCIFQRVGVASIGAGFLLAALHNSVGWGRHAYTGLIAVAALATMAIAARHVWIQHLPPGSVPVCGATLDYMLDVFPLSDVVRKVLTGSGECAKVSWRFLTLSMPAWVLIAAGGLGALGSCANSMRRR